MTRPLTDFRVLTFDCYGTLIDWETGIWDALQPLIASSKADVGRAEALAVFGRLEARQQALTPGMLYPELLTRVHAGVAEEFGLTTTGALDGAFGASVPMWPAFPDTAEALRSLASRFKLVVLSNIDNAGFAASQRKLGVDFDAVYTAENIGSYKPNPANFEYLVSQLDSQFGLGPDDVLHTAQSLFHDHVPAQRHGLATAWIDRQRLSAGGSWGATAEVEDRPTPTFRFFSMGEMAEAVRGT